MSVGTVISLFTGAMGLDLGFELEGFDTRAVVEKDRAAVATIRKNRPHIPVVERGGSPAALQQVSTEELLIRAGLRVGEVTAVIGAPPCEGYSTAGKRNGAEDHRAVEVREFLRVILEARPQFFVFEEVDAFLSAAKQHIPFYDRVAMREDEVPPSARLGSFFEEIINAFLGTGYTLSFDARNPKASVLNAADFGVAQKRKRFILIGSRDGPAVTLPEPTHPKWVSLGEAIRGLDGPEPRECKLFPCSWGKYMNLVPQGGCWKSLPPELHRVVLGGAYDDPGNAKTSGKKGGRTGYMRRLSWLDPSPTLTDSPVSKSTCLCHPEFTRPLSVKEYAKIQGFPPEWEFCGSVSAKYRLIGQATSVGLSRAVARAVKSHIAGASVV